MNDNIMSSDVVSNDTLWSTLLVYKDNKFDLVSAVICDADITYRHLFQPIHEHKKPYKKMWKPTN